MRYEVIPIIEKYLKDTLYHRDSNKTWENSFVAIQIQRRVNGECFSMQDHIRAMVYAMLSSGNAWSKVAAVTDGRGNIPVVDEIFCQYDCKQLQKVSCEQLHEKIKGIKCATQSTSAQMNVLFDNIHMLKEWEKLNGSIDEFYEKMIKIDSSMKALISVLSTIGSPFKLKQMDVALVCEYLRNVGFDLPKPDRHLRRILGKECLCFSEADMVPPYEAIDIVTKIACALSKPVAEVDYILWAYCAKEYGEVCTKKGQNCNTKCVVQKFCNKGGRCDETM